MDDIEIIALILIGSVIVTLGAAALFIRPIIAGIIIAVVCGYAAYKIFAYIADGISNKKS